jgi:hypothetical protein
MNTAAQTARLSAIGLALLSTVALGAALATVDGHRHWDRIVGMVLVMVLLGWASAAERVEWKASEAHQLDVWLATWQEAGVS